MQNTSSGNAGSRSRLALVLLLVGCSKITDPLAQPYVRDFRITGTSPGQQPAAVVTSGTAGRIDVSGAVPVPTPCYTAEPDVAIRGGGVIQLTLYARPSDPKAPCAQVQSLVNYQAVLGDFKPGTYQILISHDSGSGPVVDFTRGVSVQ